MSHKKLKELKHVDKDYCKNNQVIKIFNDLNVYIEYRDFVVIMGSSGSGKTTLLHLLGGIDKPSKGEIFFDGTCINHLSTHLLTEWRHQSIGFIFQFYNLLPMLNAIKNVELPLLFSNLTIKDRERKAAICLDVVGLKSRINHYPNEMSGGQMQRVAIARAMITDPKIFLCDEPTGNLDRDNADNILNILTFLNQKMGKTVIISTHDPEVAKRASKVIHLDKEKALTRRQNESFLFYQ